MMQFEIIGSLKACKETENFIPYEEKLFEKSGWMNVRYKFNVISGSNRFMVEISGGKWEDDKKNKIYTFSRATKDKKSEQIIVPWEKRRDPEVINNVAGYRILTCNLLSFSEQKEADEELIKKKDHKFLEPTEYARLVKKVIDSGKYADAKFKIQGNVDFQYSAQKGIFYRTLQVNKIYKVDDDFEDKAEMTINTFYTEDSLDADNGVFNCYTDYYFNNVKKRCFIPISLVLHSDGSEKSNKANAGLKQKLTEFNDGAAVRKVQLVCNMVDGAERVGITYDDLDDETKELIDLGIVEEADAIKALGGSMRGEHKTETRIVKFGQNSTKGTEPTTYEIEDLKRLPVPDVENAEEAEDLFENEDDI